MPKATPGKAQATGPDHWQLPSFDLCVQSTDLAVREALEGTIGHLGPLALDKEEISTIELVLAEALNNIVEHAYPAGQHDCPITIACLHRRDGLHITISDEGNAMPGGQVPIGMSQDVTGALKDIPEGGFGWFLIKDLAKDIRYRRVGHRNILDLRLAVAMQSAG